MVIFHEYDSLFWDDSAIISNFYDKIIINILTCTNELALFPNFAPTILSENKEKQPLQTIQTTSLPPPLSLTTPSITTGGGSHVGFPQLIPGVQSRQTCCCCSVFVNFSLCFNLALPTFLLIIITLYYHYYYIKCPFWIYSSWRTIIRRNQ